MRELVHEIRRIRLKRFFSLSESELEELSSQHEATIPFLYEIYRRYGDKMDDRMKSAVAVYMLSKGANFEKVYGSLDQRGKNRREVLESVSRKKESCN